MGQAKTLDVRLRAVAMKQAGQTNSQIAESLQIGIGTVKNLWKRHQTGGEAGLPTSYHNCGGRVGGQDEAAFRLVRLVKHLHPTWGVPFILLKVSGKYPDLRLRSARQYQRRLFDGSGEVPRPTLPPAPVPEESRIAHDTWQIDAKERFSLQTGEEACYLTVADEGTGALLAARAFSPRPDLPSPGGENHGVPVVAFPVLDAAQGPPLRQR